MTRREKLLSDLDLRASRGIEIGPLAAPVVGKEEGEIFYVDHLDQQSLRKKYEADPNVDINKIVAMDAVWGDRKLRECFPDISSFDYVIASHVIEHVPDMIGWLMELAEVLRPRGRLILAIPDKRYTFDYLREPTRLGELVDAYLRKNRRPMPAQIFDFNANAVELDLVAAWNEPFEPKSLKRFVDLRYALERSVESIRDGKYLDVHCWVFTASSLIALLTDLVDLDLLPYHCARFYEAARNSNEMVLILERFSEGTKSEKKEAREGFQQVLERLDNRELKPMREATVDDCTVRALRERARELEREIALMQNSRSWKITRPLRAARSILQSWPRWQRIHSGR
jgi:SAM-dependent methyltransferase